MNASTLYLVFAAFGFGVALSTNVQARHLGPFVAPYWLFAWLTGELAPHAILAHALMAAAFVAAGALDEKSGVAALVPHLRKHRPAGLCASARRAWRRGSTACACAARAFPARVTIWWLHGFPRAFDFGSVKVERVTNIAYGESLPGDKGGRNLLDVIRPKAANAGDKRPVLLQIHGGAWIVGDKKGQGQPLMTHMAAEHGWVCVAINYRLSPHSTFPDHIVDVKRAFAWIRAHIDEYGGDPDFVCVTGGSAGGHLAALTALSANEPRFQPGFEHVDTTVAAAVPFYGVYDLAGPCAQPRLRYR